MYLVISNSHCGMVSDKTRHETGVMWHIPKDLVAVSKAPKCYHNPPNYLRPC